MDEEVSLLSFIINLIIEEEKVDVRRLLLSRGYTNEEIDNIFIEFDIEEIL